MRSTSSPEAESVCGGGRLGEEAGVEAELVAAGGLRPGAFGVVAAAVVGEDVEGGAREATPQVVGFWRKGVGGLLEGVEPSPRVGGSGRRAGQPFGIIGALFEIGVAEVAVEAGLRSSRRRSWLGSAGTPQRTSWIPATGTGL